MIADATKYLAYNVCGNWTRIGSEFGDVAKLTKNRDDKAGFVAGHSHISTIVTNTS